MVSGNESNNLFVKLKTLKNLFIDILQKVLSSKPKTRRAHRIIKGCKLDYLRAQSSEQYYFTGHC